MLPFVQRQLLLISSVSVSYSLLFVFFFFFVRQKVLVIYKIFRCAFFVFFLKTLSEYKKIPSLNSFVLTSQDIEIVQVGGEILPKHLIRGTIYVVFGGFFLLGVFCCICFCKPSNIYIYITLHSPITSF